MKLPGLNQVKNQTKLLRFSNCASSSQAWTSALVLFRDVPKGSHVRVLLGAGDQLIDQVTSASFNLLTSVRCWNANPFGAAFTGLYRACLRDHSPQQQSNAFTTL